MGRGDGWGEGGYVKDSAAQRGLYWGLQSVSFTSLFLELVQHWLISPIEYGRRVVRHARHHDSMQRIYCGNKFGNSHGINLNENSKCLTHHGHVRLQQNRHQHPSHWHEEMAIHGHQHRVNHPSRYSSRHCSIHRNRHCSSRRCSSRHCSSHRCSIHRDHQH